MVIQLRRHNQSIAGAITLRVAKPEDKYKNGEWLIDLSPYQLKRVETLLKGAGHFLVGCEALWDWRTYDATLKYRGWGYYAIMRTGK